MGVREMYTCTVICTQADNSWCYNDYQSAASSVEWNYLSFHNSGYKYVVRPFILTLSKYYVTTYIVLCITCLAYTTEGAIFF